MPPPKTKARAKAKARAKGKARAKAQVKVQAPAKAKAQAKAIDKAIDKAIGKAQAEARAEARSQAKGKAQSKAKAQAIDKAQAEARAEARAQVKGKAKASAGFAKRIPALKRRFEKLLREETAPRLPQGRLGHAMDYAISAPGKRLRPLLCYATAEAMGLRKEQVDPPALALELVHTYSLVHDDLPCMDDDDLRRGKPSLHRAFEESTAILAGDALLTLAFEILSEVGDVPFDIRGFWTRGLALAAGGRGMVQGQALDLAGPNQVKGIWDLRDMHLYKTGRLIRMSLMMASIWREDVPMSQVEEMRDYGDLVGLAFQIHDDILDATATTEQLGKPQGSDQRQGKVTYVSLLGLKRAKVLRDEALIDADRVLANLPFDTSALAAMGRHMIGRSWP